MLVPGFVVSIIDLRLSLVSACEYFCPDLESCSGRFYVNAGFDMIPSCFLSKLPVNYSCITLMEIG